MTAPRWISEAIDAGGGETAKTWDVDADALAAALLERLPLEAMTAATHPLTTGSPVVRALADDIMAAIMRVLAEDHDVVTIAELYQGATRALDAAGVPYAVNTAEVYRPLDLVDRIRWLAEQRPTRLELQRVETERDNAWRRVELQTSQLGELRERADHVDQALRRAGVPMDELTADQGVTWLHRELDATRRQATASADDLDRRVREHQAALDDVAATELRLQTERDKLATDRDYWHALAEVRAAALLP